MLFYAFLALYLTGVYPNCEWVVIA